MGEEGASREPLSVMKNAAMTAVRVSSCLTLILKTHSFTLSLFIDCYLTTAFSDLQISVYLHVAR